MVCYQAISRLLAYGICQTRFNALASTFYESASVIFGIAQVSAGDAGQDQCMVKNAIRFKKEISQLRNLEKEALQRVVLSIEEFLNCQDDLDEMDSKVLEIQSRAQLRENSGYVQNMQYNYMHQLSLEKRQEMERMQQEDKLDQSKLSNLRNQIHSHQKVVSYSLSRISNSEMVLDQIRRSLKIYDEYYYGMTGNEGEDYHSNVQELRKNGNQQE